MTIREALEKATKFLEENEIENAKNDAKEILKSTLDLSEEKLFLSREKKLAESKVFFDKISKRANHIPLQYILGKVIFYESEFFIDENVLIPRQETEILVKQVIKFINKLKNRKIKVLDLCTGSGIIGISLAKKFREINIIASDISKKALKVAKKNAGSLKNISFIESNLFENIKEKFNIIISNPPYISETEFNSLSLEVLKEPKIAITDKSDGLSFYKNIIEKAKDFLIQNGEIFFEIGYGMEKDIIKIAENNDFELREIKSDYNNVLRVINLRRKR
ncbi:MAG: peptide chain release factor N(5)-glutamine methyltransferase [Clostridiales Family XIII bacterium]|nr:peptide chain release factor N(5)-glutamine methyltransferase [Clostridiales Family XIII bacterium]